MVSLRMWIGLWVCLATPALAAAQTQLLPPPPNSAASVPLRSPDSPPSDLKKMYEDIETMRRILNRVISTQQMGQCASCHGSNGIVNSVAFSPDGKQIWSGVISDGDRVIRLWDAATGKQLSQSQGHSQIPHPFTGAEGIYLRGVGVVYTVTLPIPPEGIREAPRKPAAPQPSDWERARRQVLGEPVEPTTVRERPMQPSLRQIILKTLADNGRHFTQLGPNDNLIVVVTFRGNVHSGMGVLSGNSGIGGGTGNFFGAVRRGQTESGGGAGLGTAGGSPPFAGLGTSSSFSQARGDAAGSADQLAGALTKPNSVRDYELLGDLVLKQGKADEAIKAYKAAVNMNPDNKQLAILYRKLAQAYLTRSQDNSALDALQRAMGLEGKEVKAKTPPRAPKAVSNLPAQLVITVSKRLAEQYATGMIPLDRFREAAQVELRKFTDPAQ